MHPLNQILFGPPGTGKTYHSIAYAVAIVEGKNPADMMKETEKQGGRAALQARFAELREKGQIGFVTFHQSFSYEDFVEGIKPKPLNGSVQYVVEGGVFQRLSADAHRGRRELELSAAEVVAQPAASTKQARFRRSYDAYVTYLAQQIGKGQEYSLLTLRKKKALITAANEGTGTITIKHDLSPYDSNVDLKRTWKVYDAYDQPEDIKPMNEKMLEIGGPNASLQWALFKDFKSFEDRFETASDQTEAEADQPAVLQKPSDGGDPRFVLLIDEINRGNIASIFGELITLLEDDKRAGALNEISVTLPYSKATFTVPPNLYLLGTMNTADRSVEALDTALRRRFSFVEMPPLPNRLAENVEGVNLQKLLTVLNQRLEALLDRDHQLGHAWLMQGKTLDALREVFARKIIPQLQEYFFGNWARIGAVLGQAFVQPAEDQVTLAPGFSLEDGDELKPRYRITAREKWTAAAFVSIYQ